MKIKRWLERLLLHVPVGLLAAWFVDKRPVAGAVFAFSFLSYEFIQEWRKADKSFKDVIGYVIGLGVGTALVIFFL